MMKKVEYGVNYTGAELSGQVIGIVGLGNIGLQGARYAKAFNLKALGFDVRAVDTEEPIEFVDFKTLRKKSDIVTLHTFLTSRTRHMISKNELELMKSDAFLIKIPASYIPYHRLKILAIFI